MKKPKKILVIRNDKLGDFMLAWPAFALLKSQFPQAEVTALVPEYTEEIARQCQWIDKILIDNRLNSTLTDVLALAKKIRSNHYDVSISLFSEIRTSLALYIANIPARVGPATKIAQLFLNKTIRQKRSRSLKPEYEYNIDIIRFYIDSIGEKSTLLTAPPFLCFGNDEIQTIRKAVFDGNNIDINDTLIFIHPGTGGSAINLSLEQYAQLAQDINSHNRVYFIITAGPGETGTARKLSVLLSDVNHHIHTSTGSIVDFAKFLNTCDIFISGSTGPLHIAAALNINTVAFYPARRSATSLRWQTINQNEKRLSFSPDCYTGENDMMQIDLELASKEIIKKFLA